MKTQKERNIEYQCPAELGEYKIKIK